MCLLFVVEISKELFGQHNKILLCLKGGGQADGFRCMWCLTTPPSNISVYLPKHLPICKQPAGPCPKSKVTMLSSWLKLGSVPQWAWANRGVARCSMRLVGRTPCASPWGWGRWAGCEQSWVESHSHGSRWCGGSDRHSCPGQGTLHTAGSEAMGCGPTELFQIEQFPSVSFFYTKAPTLFLQNPSLKNTCTWY